jgi:integrase/recombinase XerD
VIDDFSAYQQVCSFSPLTILRRRKSLSLFLRHIAPRDFADATVDDIEAWLATKEKATTRYTYLADLRSFYKWAVKRGHLEFNPAAEVDTVRKPRSLPKPLGSNVLSVISRGRLRTRQMAALGLFAGLRCAEIANLRGDDIDVPHGVLIVRHGKGDKDRVVPLHPELVRLLEGVPSSGWLFTRNGRPIQPGSVSRTLKEHLHRCGIEATAHQLRHTFGTELARQMGGNLLAVARLMGHSSTETTKGYTAWVADAAPEVCRMFTEKGAA